VSAANRSAAAKAPPIDVGWADLTQVVLLGTSRRAVPAGVRTGRIGLPDAPDEVLILGAAAASAAWRAAGPRLAVRPDVDLEPAAEDPRPAAPSEASQLLRLVLEGGARVGDADSLVLRWLERAAAAGYRVGHGELVPVLTWASVATGRRGPAKAAIGVRGAWLAAEPAWSWAVGADDVVPTDVPEAIAARFRDGRRDERPDLLRQARAVDPGLGRQLLDEARATDPAPARLALVQAMSDHLSVEDEPLLEAMLDDRAASVRNEVADLLSRLPDSRYARRMAQRLAPLVESGRRSLAVALPTAFDDQAARDAIDTADGPGKRAEARRRIVVGTPLAFWSQLDHDPAKVAARVDADLFGDLTVAACRQVNPRWAAALAGRQPRPDLIAVWAGADAAGAAARCIDVLHRASTPEARRTAVGLVSALPGPWSLALSREVIAAARHEPDAWRLQPYLELGPRLDAGVLPALNAWLEEQQRAENPVGLKVISSLRHSIDLRIAIDASLPLPATVPDHVRNPR